MDFKDEDILEALSKSPNGTSIKEILHALGLKIPRRTLQRRLANLVEVGSIKMEGAARGAKYYLFSIPPKTTDVLANQLLLSSSAMEIKQYVEMPLQNRTPVGYNRSFLDSYQPNQTFYLSEEIRSHLKQIGGLRTENKTAGTYGRNLLNRLLIDLSWNSSRLEGNTYSLLETERLIVDGKEAEGRSQFETQMILNHKSAIEFLVESVNELGFNSYTILNLHAILSDGLLLDPKACGSLRRIPVGISGTVYHPLEIPRLVEENFKQILDKISAIEDPYEQAFFPLVHLSYLQPFEDVNKRVSRLSANIPLIQHNLCPLSFIDVFEKDYVDGILGVYELNRIDMLKEVFVWAYERSAARYAAIQQSLGEPDAFKLGYRNQIHELISDIIRNRLDKKESIKFIEEWTTNHIPHPDQNRFIEYVDRELLSLHPGNFARYRVRLSEYNEWSKNWI